jgi:type VI secretion system protein ImpA
MDGLAGMMPSDVGDSGNLLDDLSISDSGTAGSAAPAPRARPAQAGLSGAIDTRLDALRAIDMVCEYLERTEPTNPAQLLLRRARKLVDKNFLELVREFAPQSVEEVARILGVPADDSHGSSY